MEQIKDIFKQVRQAKGSLAFCKEEIINDTLYALADRVEAATDRILEENAKDLAAMDPSNPKYDRLKLTAERIHAIAQGIRQVATLPSPSGRILSEAVRPNGMKLIKVSVPFGVIGIIYEARPNDFGCVCTLFQIRQRLYIKRGKRCRFLQPYPGGDYPEYLAGCSPLVSLSGGIVAGRT